METINNYTFKTFMREKLSEDDYNYFLTKYEILFIKNILNYYPSVIQEIEKVVENIMIENENKYLSIQLIVLFVSDIYKKYYTDHYIPNINLFSVIKFTLGCIFTSNLIILNDEENKQTIQILDTSMKLLMFSLYF